MSLCYAFSNSSNSGYNACVTNDKQKKRVWNVRTGTSAKGGGWTTFQSVLGYQDVDLRPQPFVLIKLYR